LFDYGLSLVLSRGPQSALLRIEGLFKLKLDGDWEIDPSGDRSSLCPSLKLFKRTIESAALLGTGEPELVFSGDARLPFTAAGSTKLGLSTFPTARWSCREPTEKCRFSRSTTTADTDEPTFILKRLPAG
jgi:hypothetical protein